MLYVFVSCYVAFDSFHIIGASIMLMRTFAFVGAWLSNFLNYVSNYSYSQSLQNMSIFESLQLSKSCVMHYNLCTVIKCLCSLFKAKLTNNR